MDGIGGARRCIVKDDLGGTGGTADVRCIVSRGCARLIIGTQRKDLHVRNIVTLKGVQTMNGRYGRNDVDRYCPVEIHVDIAHVAVEMLRTGFL